MFALCIPFCSYSSDNYSMVLKNERMLIILDMKCTPCDIECKNIHYRLFDIKKVMQKSGRAESINTGVNGNFVGYRLLVTNKISYMLTASAINDLWEINEESNLKSISKDSINPVFDDGTC